nr:hypothetical protein [Tanacetum cinerariifolium]
VSRHQNTQQYDVMLPIELTNEEIRNTKAYKEYYVYATAPKPKASARRKKSEEKLSWNSSDDEGANAQERDEDDNEGDEGDESDDGEEDDNNNKDGDER